MAATGHVIGENETTGIRQNENQPHEPRPVDSQHSLSTQHRQLPQLSPPPSQQLGAQSFQSQQSLLTSPGCMSSSAAMEASSAGTGAGVGVDDVRIPLTATIDQAPPVYHSYYVSSDDCQDPHHVTSPLVTSRSRSCSTLSNKPSSKKLHLGRNEKFHKRFKNVPETESVLQVYHCAYVSDILLQGFLYVTPSNFCFYSKILARERLIEIAVCEVVNITRERTAFIIPNAIGIVSTAKKYVFGSLVSRDRTYRLLYGVWEKYASRNERLTPQSPSFSPPEAKEAASHSSLEKSSEDDSFFSECEGLAPSIYRCDSIINFSRLASPSTPSSSPLRLLPTISYHQISNTTTVISPSPSSSLALRRRVTSCIMGGRGSDCCCGCSGTNASLSASVSGPVPLVGFSTAGSGTSVHDRLRSSCLASKLSTPIQYTAQFSKWIVVHVTQFTDFILSAERTTSWLLVCSFLTLVLLCWSAILTDRVMILHYTLLAIHNNDLKYFHPQDLQRENEMSEAFRQTREREVMVVEKLQNLLQENVKLYFCLVEKVLVGVNLSTSSCPVTDEDCKTFSQQSQRSST